MSTSSPLFLISSHLGHHRDCYTEWSKLARKKHKYYILVHICESWKNLCTQSYSQQEWRHRCREQHLCIFALAAVGVRGRTRSEGERPAPRLLHQPSLKGMAVGPWMHVWKPWELNPGEASLCRERRTGLPISRQQRCGTGVSWPCQKKEYSSGRNPVREEVSTWPWEPAGKSHLDAAFQSILWGVGLEVLFCDLRPKKWVPAERIPYLIERWPAKYTLCP